MLKNALLLLLLLATVHSFSQPAEDEKVKESITAFFSGLSNFDESALKSTITNDFIVLEQGKVWNVDSLIKRFETAKKLQLKRTFTMEFVSVNVQQPVAWVSYFNTADVIVDDKKRQIKWLESAVLLRQSNEWKIQLLHSTKIEQHN